MSKEKQIEEKSCHKCLHYCACIRNSEYYPDRPCFAYEDKEDYRKQSEGEWISNRQTDEYICSLCGAIAPVDCLKEDFYKSEFCPNCGAKMKGGAE